MPLKGFFNTIVYGFSEPLIRVRIKALFRCDWRRFRQSEANGYILEIPY